MKTIIRITEDVYSEGSYNEHVDEINYLVNNEIEVDCKISNDRFLNQVEEQKNYNTNREDFKNKTTFTAIGYVQGDWQEFTLYHNEPDDSVALQRLVDELKKSFTHFNDYTVEKFERTEIDGKVFNSDPYDYTNFSIRHIEFPDEDDIKEAYLEIYGKDYDEIEIEIK